MLIPKREKLFQKFLFLADSPIPTAIYLCRRLCIHPRLDHATEFCDEVPRRKWHFLMRNWIPPACRAGKHPKSGAEGAPEWFRAEKGIISCAEEDTTRLPGRKMPQIRRGRCSEAVPGRKRHHFLHGIGYHPPAGQENAQNPARKVIRGGSGQKKVSFPAQKRIPPACRGRKCLFNPKIFTV